jgi:hypothetical protein
MQSVKPQKLSPHKSPISLEIYDRVIDVLKIPDYWMRQDSVTSILKIEKNAKLFSQINEVLHDHTCRECEQIRPLAPNREAQHKKYMRTYAVQRSQFSSDKDAMTAHIELDQKFYREVYCLWCGNMKKLATPEEEVENFKSHYQ